MSGDVQEDKLRGGSVEMVPTDCQETRDPDAGAKVLCAYYGDWDWDKITEKAKDQYRSNARDIAEAYDEGATDGHMPLLHGLGIGFNYGGAGAPDCR